MSSDNSISFFPTSISHLKSSVEKTDDDGFLQIYSYSYCGNNSQSDLKQCRGLIFNNDELVVGSLGFTDEYTVSDKDLVSSLPFSDYTFFSSEEGTLIRIFYCNKKWYVSTHRKLDAFKSRWGSSTSFGDIFTEYIHDYGYDSVDDLTSKLDVNHVYFFLIRNNNETKIVSDPSTENRVYFAGCLLNGQEFSFSVSNLSIPSQNKLSFSSWDDVYKYVESSDPKKSQGVIGFSDRSKNIPFQLKIVSTKYQLYSQVRGNEPNLFYRYLKVRSNPLYSKLIYELYPDSINTFILYENTIIKIAKNIHNSYVSRFVNKNFVVVSQEEYKIIKECHGFHISDRRNKITLNHVIGVLNNEKYSYLLYVLIKRYLSQ